AQPAPQPTSFQIEVGPNQRLRDIAVENLGDFNQELLHQIQALNPKLNDPDHIEAGQRLWLPGLPAAKGADALTPNARRETKVAPVLVSTGKPIGSEASSNAAPFEVIVGPNQTLQDLSVKYLGDFDLKRLHQIRALNPKLIDPDHILLGQKIRLPGPPAAPVVADTTPTTSLRRVP
ncbi:MAG: LysM peptidoglycan-binding domain-containing protein, partial [Terracidiphilus sp.]